MKWLIFTCIGVGISWGLMAKPAQADECQAIAGESQRFNTINENGVIVLGQSYTNPYVVVVPGNKTRELQTLRQCVPDAFVSRNRLGVYIHAGSFRDYTTAKRLERVLRSRNLDARIVYFRRGRK